MSVRIYIAGPMTGLPGYNYPAFMEAAESLRARGFHVENPAENPPCGSWQRFMRMGIGQLLTCDAILLLAGWEASPGASIEHRLALGLGMAVYIGQVS